MAGSLLYALFLYRAKISTVRIFSAKLTVNVLVNILMGSCWSAMLYGKGYLYYLVKSVVKNLALWPLESLLFLLFIQLLLPMLTKRRYLFGNPDGKLFEGKYLFRENGAAHNVKFTAKLLNALGLIVFTAFAVVRFYDAPVWTEGLLRRCRSSQALCLRRLRQISSILSALRLKIFMQSENSLRRIPLLRKNN